MYFKEIEKIQENPEKFVPYVDLEDDQVVIRNANKHCVEYVESKISNDTKLNFLSYIDKLKKCGIYHKDAKILEKIGKNAPNDLTKNILEKKLLKI